MTKKCTKTLITAVTSQMNGGKAMTPGLSDDAFVSVQGGLLGEGELSNSLLANAPAREDFRSSEFRFDPISLVVPFGVRSAIGKTLTRSPNPGFIGTMKTKTLGLILAVCFLSAGACFADPHKGTWKLNEAKSMFGKGTGRNNVVNYEYEFPGLRTKVLIDGVDASGHAFHSVWEGRFDGNERPVTGDPNSDSRSYTKVNEYVRLHGQES